MCLTVLGPFPQSLDVLSAQNFKRTFSLTHLMMLIRKHFDSSRIQTRTYPFLHCLFIYFFINPLFLSMYLPAGNLLTQGGLILR